MYTGTGIHSNRRTNIQNSSELIINGAQKACRVVNNSPTSLHNTKIHNTLQTRNDNNLAKVA